HVRGQSDLVSDTAESLHHGGCHFLQALGPGELIGVRKEITFECCGFRRKIGNQSHVRRGDTKKVLTRPESGILNRLGNVENRIALGNYNRVDVYIPADRKSTRLNS